MLDKIRTALATVEAEAKEAHKAATDLYEKMVAEGIDPTKDKDAFAKVDEAFKAYSVKAEEITDLQGQLDRASTIEGLSRPAPRQNGARRLSLVPDSDRNPDGTLSLQRPTRIGARFTESEQYKAMHTSGAFKSDAAFQSAMGRGLETPVDLLSRDELEAILRAGGYMAVTVTGGGATSAGPFILQDLVPGFVEYLRKRPSVAALVGQGTTDSDVVEFVSQSAPTNAGAETAEDTAAPESTFPFATNTTNVREITHFVPVTLRAMADFGQIRTIIENELAAYVLDRLDTQVYSGNGVGVNLTGIVNAAGINTRALGTDSRLDALHKAMTQIRVAAGVLLEPDAVIMHPNDWEQVRLEKDANGQYLLGPAGMSGDKVVWGVPVIASTVATENTVLVGNYERGATLWLREGLAVTTGLSGTDFTQRRVSILAAMRLAFAVTRAGAFTTVTGF